MKIMGGVKMLTKEECLLKYNALKNLSDYPILCGTENDEDLKPTPFNELFKEELECFEQLINEHFELKEKYEKAVKCYKNATSQYSKLESKYVLLKSNPPLKFEDLKEGMWVWDNIANQYIYIKFKDEIVDDYKRLGHKRVGYNGEFVTNFEENRFYKYEVEDC